MYKEHYCFSIDGSDNQTIWRYMDFTKLISMLDSKCLYFCRADHLEDKYEGSLPPKYVEDLKSLFATADVSDGDAAAKKLVNFAKVFKGFVYINSWHVNEHESAAMWKLYLKSNEGLAIRSTVARLKQGFRESPADVFIGNVEYVDYSKATIPDTVNAFRPFLYKRKSFEYEQELRAIVTQEPKKVEDKETAAEGLYIPVDLDTLVEQIAVCPTAPRWFPDLVRKTMQRFNINKPVTQSNLYGSPLY